MKILLPSLSMQFNSNNWVNPYLVRETNCYAYGLNLPGLSINPGCLAEYKYLPNKRGYSDFITSEKLRALLLRDGLRPIAPRTIRPDKFHVIAAFGAAITIPQFDQEDSTGKLFANVESPQTILTYHIYRADADGGFSHKFPTRPPEKIGEVGLEELHEHYQGIINGNPNLIKAYTVSAGLFMIRRSGVPISELHTDSRPLCPFSHPNVISREHQTPPSQFLNRNK